MRVEKRDSLGRKTLVLYPETEEEQKLIDEYLGNCIPLNILGQVDYQWETHDEICRHFIVLWNPVKNPLGRAT